MFKFSVGLPKIVVHWAMAKANNSQNIAMSMQFVQGAWLWCNFLLPKISSSEDGAAHCIIPCWTIHNPGSCTIWEDRHFSYLAWKFFTFKGQNNTSATKARSCVLPLGIDILPKVQSESFFRGLKGSLQDLNTCQTSLFSIAWCLRSDLGTTTKM